MKYEHNFATQKEAVLYFLRVLISAGSYGSEKSNKKVVEAFKASLGFAEEKKRVPNPFRRFPSATGLLTTADIPVSTWYRRAVTPIIEFYKTVPEKKGDVELANPNFSANIQAGDGQPLTGSLVWRAMSPEERMISIAFAADGSAVMKYDLGIRDGLAIPKSEFLGLPLPGDIEIKR